MKPKPNNENTPIINGAPDHSRARALPGANHSLVPTHKKWLALPLVGLLVNPAGSATVVGGAAVVALVVLIICGFIYIGAQLLDKAKTISARHEFRLTNEMGDFRATGGRAPDPVIERLLAMPEEVLVPSERMEFASDAEFFKWADSLKTWVILYRETLADEWVDSGNRLYGASNEVRAVLLDLCRWEGVWAGRGMTKDGRWRTQGFYRQVEE